MGPNAAGHNREKRRVCLILTGIVVLAFILRFAGFNWGGDGTTFHPDEGKTYKDAMRMARNLYFLSSSTVYPAQVSQKLLAVIYAVYIRIARAAGTEWTEIGCIYIARILSAVCGTAAVYFSFLVGEKLRCGAGLFAAFFTGTFGPIVAQAHNAVMDEEVGLCTVLALLFAVGYLEADDKKAYIRLGALSAVCAAATLEKWYGGILCFLIVLVVACREKCPFRQWAVRFVTHGAFSAACFVVVFGLIAPNLLRHPSQIFEGMRHVSSDYGNDASALSTLGTDVTWFLSYAGILSLVLIAAAVTGFVRDRIKTGIVLLIGLAEPVIMAVTGRDAHLRWLQPMFICLLIAMAAGCVYLRQAVSYDKRRRGARPAAAAVTIIVMVNVFANGFLMTALYAANGSDTSNISERYLRENGILPENCIYDRYTCIMPGGVSKYFDSVAVEDSFTKIDGERYVTKLGRRYALSRDSQVSGLDNIAVFEPDYEFNKYTPRNYGRPSAKWIDLYGMGEALYYGAGIASGRLSAGQRYSLDDISQIKGVQYIEPGDFTASGDDMEYMLSAIDAGRYEVTLYSDDDAAPENMRIMIMPETGDVHAVYVIAGADPVQFEIFRDEIRAVVTIPIDSFGNYTIEIKEIEQHE